MLRLSELALFLSPFILFGVWRFALAWGLPSTRVVAAVAGVLVLMVGTMMWLAADRALPPGTVYVPAHLENGRIVPGHAVPGASG
jgi:hypothetical protein